MQQDPRNIQIKDYNYDLPDEKIAKYPLANRDASKLLVYSQDKIREESFSNLQNWIPTDSLMIFNNTKVIQARMVFKKSTGARIEIFCLEPISPRDYIQVFETTESCVWKCMIGNAKKWKNEDLELNLSIRGKDIQLNAKKCAREEGADAHDICFSWNNENVLFADILEAVGELPIPPYLHRDTEDADKETYQTVYSKIKGSVAAPTAGLHFTPVAFEKLKAKGVRFGELTLHVGAGTFKPVKSEHIGEHGMHAELIVVEKQLLETILEQLKKQQPIIAVGTTSVRTLESLYYLGLQVYGNKNETITPLIVSQWDPYDNATDCRIDVVSAIEALIGYLEENNKTSLVASTQIIIAPGFQFRLVDGIVTNFHQPQSTLLLLVSAFVGADNWQNIYNFALNNDFRFLSYGDSSLLLRSKNE